MAVRLDASGDGLSRSANLPTALAFTICGWATRQGNGGANDVVLATIRNTAYSAWHGIYRSSAGNIQVNGTAGATTIIAAPANGEPFFWAVACSASGAGNLRGYARAATAAALTAATQTSATFTVNSISVGNNAGFDTVEWWNGDIWNVKSWSRGLSAAEILIESYYSNAMFPSSINFHWPLPNVNTTQDFSGNARNPTVGGTLATADGAHGLWIPRRRIFLPSGAAAYALAADQGSYSLTGQAAGLRATRTIGASQGSYVLTGQDAGLPRGLRLLADQGVYTLSGQAAGLLAARLLAAAQGIYTLDGQAVTLTYSGAGPKVLAADSGTYTLSGQDAVVRVARSLLAAQGTYSLSGQAAAFARTHALVAELGSYLLTGRDVTLTYSGSSPPTGDDWIIRSRRRGRR